MRLQDVVVMFILAGVIFGAAHLANLSVHKWTFGIAFIALYGLYYILSAKLRSWRVGKVAGKYDLKVDPGASQVHNEDYIRAPLVNDKSPDYANWFCKHADGLRVDVFDYTCTQMTQTGEADMRYVITAVRTHHGHPNWPEATPYHWPSFAIRPRGVGRRFLEFFGLPRIGMFVDRHPRFAKRHILTSPDEFATGLVFEEGLLNHLAALSDLHLCSAGPWLVIRHGPGYTPLPARMIPKTIELAVGLYRAFPPLEEVGIPAPEPEEEEIQDAEDHDEDFFRMI